MAERRMFSKSVIDSDCFLDMPLTAQALYFHLALRADDDGFINNPKSIMRNVCCKDDDLKMLIAKKFLIAFDSGIVVIRHWKIHNYIQKDRYKATIFSEEKSRLNLDENGVYTECIQNGYKLDTQVRLGEDSLGKDSLEREEKPKGSPPPALINSDLNSFKQYGKYKHVKLSDNQFSALVNDYGQNIVDKYVKKVDEYCQQHGKPYNDYDLTIRRWITEDKDKQPDHSYDLDEFEEFTLNCVPELGEKKQSDDNKQDIKIRYGNYI